MTCLTDLSNACKGQPHSRDSSHRNATRKTLPLTGLCGADVPLPPHCSFAPGEEVVRWRLDDAPAGLTIKHEVHRREATKHAGDLQRNVIACAMANRVVIPWVMIRQIRPSMPFTSKRANIPPVYVTDVVQIFSRLPRNSQTPRGPSCH